MTLAVRLRDRWNRELKYWRLSWWQLVLLLVWSYWGWICNWLIPGYPELWLLPQTPFLGIGYFAGGLFMALFPGQPWAFPLGISLTVFLLTYLALVSWRWRREGKQEPAESAAQLLRGCGEQRTVQGSGQ